MPMIKTPNKSNFLHPARKTPDADDTATAIIVSQYRDDKRAGVISKIIKPIYIVQNSQAPLFVLLPDAYGPDRSHIDVCLLYPVY